MGLSCLIFRFISSTFFLHIVESYTYINFDFDPSSSRSYYTNLIPIFMMFQLKKKIFSNGPTDDSNEKTIHLVNEPSIHTVMRSFLSTFLIDIRYGMQLNAVSFWVFFSLLKIQFLIRQMNKIIQHKIKRNIEEIPVICSGVKKKSACIKFNVKKIKKKFPIEMWLNCW